MRTKAPALKAVVEMRNMMICLWFDGDAEEAARFYVSVFPKSKLLETAKYLVETPSDKPIGSVMSVTFELNGQKFMALNGGPMFKFSEAISFIITCKDQKEIDYFYKKLSAVPEAEICGWLKDKYGVSWQLVSASMEKILGGKGKNSARAMEALLDMKRLDLKALDDAYKGR